MLLLFTLFIRGYCIFVTTSFCLFSWSDNRLLLNFLLLAFDRFFTLNLLFFLTVGHYLSIATRFI